MSEQTRIEYSLTHERELEKASLDSERQVEIVTDILKVRGNQGEILGTLKHVVKTLWSIQEQLRETNRKLDEIKERARITHLKLQRMGDTTNG